MVTTAEFKFRIYVSPLDGDPPVIAVWYHGLEVNRSRTVAEWVYESFQDNDHRQDFELAPDKYWQVVGTARLHGAYDWQGEYDETIDILEFQKLEMSEEAFMELSGLNGGSL